MTGRTRRDPAIARSPFGGAGLAFLPILLILLVAVPAAAQEEGWGRVLEEEEEPAVRPYLLGYSGFGEPADDAYDQVFTKPFIRFGGGFGMQYHSFGAEVLLRQGSVKEAMPVTDQETGDVVQRNFSLKTTEVQLRLYGAPGVGPFRFPSGVGIGLTTVSVDRGYQGVWDSYLGAGVLVTPYVGVEYAITETFAVGIEAEYGFSQPSFDANPSSEDQFSDNFVPINQAGDSFWDTVGGYDEEDFRSGGFIVSVRAVVHIPTFQGEENGS